MGLLEKILVIAGGVSVIVVIIIYVISNVTGNSADDDAEFYEDMMNVNIKRSHFDD